jgi:monothiol glutaredoxin
MPRNVLEEIAAEVQQNPVVLYMKGSRHMPQCGFSAALVAVLNDEGVAYKDVNVLADPDVREGVKRFSDWPTVPQLYVNGTFVGGCDIVREMHSKGELHQVLAQVPRAKAG